MLRIKQNIIAPLRQSPDVAALKAALTTAVELEFSTIPPYLTGLFSIVADSNRVAAALIQSIVTEEMLHMTLAANMLIAIGGNPDIVALGQSLKYPGPLPDKIGNDLQVDLAALTPSQVKNVFMAIERPVTKPGEILPGETVSEPTPVVPGEFGSIGEFYEAIWAAMEAVNGRNPELFAHPRLEQQVDISKWFPPVRTAPENGYIVDLKTVRQAIDTIILQGEGIDMARATLPVDGDGSYAHYYKFGEIFHERRLVPDPEAVSGWSYAGAPVPLEQERIYNFLPNAALSDYIPGTPASLAAQRFYGTYQVLLASLNKVFNGQPNQLDSALGLMYQLKLQAQQVAQCTVSGNRSNLVAAPPFMQTH
ncbi:ferritin-like protein [Chromobacterium sp. IIBBL 290-4]|uniref:ferritin-like domain-containing protein n=1 Tax=Chromobacterium sp. IIBBL 290-4 TaxID=2953890 RepID=UPI0020B6F10B|nr:ferritin-like protein [Chromobacterium sp. IIBBL 290-4]UTH73780.1 ferritin-like protein [Chromobacterium sp. IIBBL 290-4]